MLNQLKELLAYSGRSLSLLACSSAKIRFACVAMTIPFLSSCDFVQNLISENLYKGTHLGVEYCVKRNKTVSVAENVIRAACASKHQKQLESTYVSGRAQFNSYPRQFSGNIQNQFGNQIVTEITIIVKYDDENPFVFDTIVLDGLWIEPKMEGTFSAREAEFIFFPSDPNLLEGWTWQVTNVWGIELKLR